MYIYIYIYILLLFVVHVVVFLFWGEGGGRARSGTSPPPMTWPLGPLRRAGRRWSQPQWYGHSAGASPPSSAHLTPPPAGEPLVAEKIVETLLEKDTCFNA